MKALSCFIQSAFNDSFVESLSPCSQMAREEFNLDFCKCISPVMLLSLQGAFKVAMS